MHAIDFQAIGYVIAGVMMGTGIAMMFLASKYRGRK